jgi:excisionase family DNA binding protein
MAFDAAPPPTCRTRRTTLVNRTSRTKHGNPAPETEAILVSVEEAARMLSVCRATLYKLLASGDVQAVRIGRRTLIPVEALKIFAASLPGYDAI